MTSSDSSSNRESMVPGRRTRVAVLSRTLQPYHIARLRACGSVFDIHCIEAFKRVGVIPAVFCATEEQRDGVAVATLLPSDTQTSASAIWTSVISHLDTLDPDLVAAPAWSEVETLGALYWSLTRRRRAITFSESCFGDKPRRPGASVADAR